MDGRLSILLLTGFVLCLLPPEAEGCSCAMQHPQDHFCKSDFVIKMRVKRVDSVQAKNGMKVKTNYTIGIEKIFKSSEAFRNITQTQLYSPAHDSMCGVQLTARQKYLVMGTVRDGALQINSCGMYKEWAIVSKSQRRALKVRYQQNCDCKVNICWSPKCQKKKDLERNACRWNPREDPGFCFDKHSFCKRRQDGRCKWSRTPDWKQCVSEVETERNREP